MAAADRARDRVGRPARGSPAFLGLAVAAWGSDDAALIRGAYLAMEVTGWWVLVPLSIACLLTGLVQSLSTEWGLFLYYWVLVTLAINVVASAVILPFMNASGN